MRQRFLSGWFGKGIFAIGLVIAVFGALHVMSALDLGSSGMAMAQEAAAPAADGTSGGGGSSNMLLKAIQALGLFFGGVFFLLSFTLFALFIMNLLAARRDAMVPALLVEAFEAHLNEKRYQEAYELAKADESVLGQVLSAGLAKVSQGYEKAIEAMQEVGEEENMKLEHRLGYVALIGTISPMVGLLGTVWGMILAFQKLTTGEVGADALAGDISTALVTTLCGLLLAIPAISAFTILRNRVQRLVLEVGILSEGLMSRFQNVPAGATGGGAAGAKPGGPQAPTGKPGAAPAAGAKPAPGAPAPGQPAPGAPAPKPAPGQPGQPGGPGGPGQPGQ